MSAGRIGVYFLILAASLASARYFSRKHGPRAAPTTGLPRVPAAPEVAAAAPPARLSTSASAPPPSPSSDEVLSEALCPADMAWVGAEACATFARRCVREEGGACVAFAPAECRSGQRLRFCVDRYEYPNHAGMLPATVVTFAQARMACEEEHKRLCTEVEWALACEGKTGLAFPYGDELDRSACNANHPLPKMATDALWEPRNVSVVVSRVDARVPSGESARCVTAQGVYDLVGNVEEWVTSVTGYHGALRGGGYPDASPACRTVRQMSDPSYRSVTTGFRCCRDPLVRPGRPAHGAPPAESEGARERSGGSNETR